MLDRFKLTDQGGSMTIAAHRLLTTRLFLFDPHVLLGIKYAQRAVVLLAVIPAKDVQLLAIQCGSVVLDLRGGSAQVGEVGAQQVLVLQREYSGLALGGLRLRNQIPGQLALSLGLVSVVLPISTSPRG